MNVIVAGCGRVGAALADSLDAEGHDVVVIDKRPEAFRRLREGYGGRTLQGIVFDRDTLEEAGIREAHAFIAVTSGDNSNIVSARTVRERFGVEHVIARIYDPQRAEIYERLGVVTVAAARWTVDEIRRGLLSEEEQIDAALGAGAGEVVIVSIPVPEGVTGVDARQLDDPGRWTVAAVTREGRTEVPHTDALIGGGDRVHLAVQRDAVSDVRARVLSLGGAR